MKNFLKRYLAFMALFFSLVFLGATTQNIFFTPEAVLRFNLTDQHGKQVTEKKFSGAPAMIFFGYTRCPSICPRTLSMLSDTQKELLKQRRQVKIIFVTLDPDHDKPAVMAEYLSRFPANITGLTGPRKNLSDLYAAFQVYPGGSGGDMIADHSGLAYLVDGRGRLKTSFTAQMKPETVYTRIVSALKKETPS